MQAPKSNPDLVTDLPSLNPFNPLNNNNNNNSKWTHKRPRASHREEIDRYRARFEPELLLYIGQHTKREPAKVSSSREILALYCCCCCCW